MLTIKLVFCLLFAFALCKEEKKLTNEFIVKVHPGTPLLSFLSDHGVTLKKKFSYNENVLLVSFEREVPQFHLSPHVIFAERVRVMENYGPKVTWDNDPLYSEQYHLEDSVGIQDINVQPAWNAGFFGSGVLVSIIDSGVDKSHPDISPRYVDEASYDFINDDADASPANVSEDHGQACAGLVGAAGDNNSCGVGVAPESSLAGVLLITTGFTNAAALSSLTFRTDIVDIYSNSWGPSDDGGLYPISQTETDAFETSVTNGRGGLGVIYTWAGGNGRQSNDNSNYDGLANSRFTIAVGAIQRSSGDVTVYSEDGANLIVVAPSSDDTDGVRTTGLEGGCLSDFGGTSAACPMVSGGVAIILEVNPALGWRDVQGVLIHSCAINLPEDLGWTVNGAGLLVNHKFGFGRLDVGAAVDVAAGWTNYLTGVSISSGTIDVGEAVSETGPEVTATWICPDDIIVEHVEITFSITHTFRGDLVITITSPEGTESILHDTVNEGGDFGTFTFMTVRSWDEMSAGDWILSVSDAYAGDEGVFNSYEVVVYGRCPVGKVEDGGVCIDDVLPEVVITTPDATVEWKTYAPACIAWDISAMPAELGTIVMKFMSNGVPDSQTIVEDFDMTAGTYEWERVFGINTGEVHIEFEFPTAQTIVGPTFHVRSPLEGVSSACVVVPAPVPLD